MKEYANGGSTVQEQYYGCKLCSAQMLIECKFGQLKACLGILKRPLDININEVAHVIYACFVLHHFCELNDKFIAKERVQVAIHYDNRFQPPTV
uniref:DDE Tnp4 domain-containing protein n=1 Tax=Amphimedon queenslandica TaxID=400682 RepID=A0A1X7V8J7_AMPQE